MFKNNKKEIFSIRKFKNGRSDSVKVGTSILLTLLTTGNNFAPALAAEINGNQLPEVVSSTDKVSSDKATTFNNSNGEKIFSVDAVLGQDVAEPTKANNNTGEADGTDTLNVRSEAKVNYILDEDKSKLKDSKTVEAGTGTIKTPYDKKGLAYDTDGKDYRKSVVDKGGISVTEETGKEEIIKANGKAYQLQRSEVVDKDKIKYDKTTFNDIEATVSPEDMHNELGEIDYTKIKGKVYLVEETSEGQYGKFVEANNITSDAEAVKAWKEGQANAKDFTKANVTLQEGDTIIVMDKDTYAVTKAINKKETQEGRTITYTTIDNTEENVETDPFAMTYAIQNETYETIIDAGSDNIFGTNDDVSVHRDSGVGTNNIFRFDLNSRPEISSNLLPKTPALDHKTSSIKDILKDIHSTNYRVLDFFSSIAEKQEDITKINTAKAQADTKIDELIEFMKTNNIRAGIFNDEVYFYDGSQSSEGSVKLSEFEAKMRDFVQVLDDMPTITKETRTYVKETDPILREHPDYNHDPIYGDVEKIVTEKYTFDSNNGITKEITTRYKRDGWDYTEWDSNINRSTENVEYNTIKNETNWTMEVAPDKSNVVFKKSTHTEEPTLRTDNNYEVTNTKKEIITPVRAYKVVSDGTATVNHYYTLKTEPEELKETVETKGSVVVKYVDQNGNEIKAPNTVVPETVIKTVKKYETKSDITVVSTREDVIDNTTAYNTKSALKNEIRTEDGKLYRYRAVLPTDNNLNNTTDETGNVKEGVTTVIYQYDLIIPVDPTQPKTPGNPELPQPEDKIPNDPQNRSYKDLGLVKNVERNITYVYENGPKAGQEASTPVKQEAKFTRTAEINARTGEVTYKTEWTPAKKLNEVVSPTKDKYSVDKDKVEELTVDNTSENTSVVVKYRENPDVIDHDAEKDKKGTVKVKHIDAQGNVLEEETVKDNVVVATATTKVYADRDPETTYTPTNEEYSTVDKRKDVIEKDGKKYKFSKLVEATPELNNSVEETGKIKEGTTTVVYQYDYLIPVDPTKPNEGQTTPPKPTDRVPGDPQGRTYGELGLVKNVERNITYVYENGPKAGQEASTPVKQEARFTRTALINSRTGEVTYETNWTSAQKLNEVVSPTKDKYSVDKDKVEELTVDNTSENTSVVVKYRENPDVIDHDAEKDKKGTVKVKHIDDQGNVLEEETVKENIVVATATTKVYADRVPETTYTPTNEEYSTVDKRKEVINKDNKEYKFVKLVEATPELNNSVEETGKIKEGTTTVVYQYDYLIPVDPTKPNEGETTPPKPTDRVPGDPQGRTYADLGLVKNVERNITYVYENGPKAGQEVSSSVKQEARFTRTAKINRRTGEVTYETNWTPSQKLNEVVSPTKEKYVADKVKVEEATVDNTSESTNVVVKYRENPDVIDHDAEKDKKGTVKVKHIDDQGNVLEEETVKDNVVVATATTKVYADRDAETTYTPTNEKYSTIDRRKESIEKNKIKYKFSKLVEATPELNNTTEEEGTIKEGITTIVYQYDYTIPVDPTKPEDGKTNPPAPSDKIPGDPKGRTYGDLGLVKEVERTITYVYEDGPKAGQEASTPVKQKARFTRTAEINRRTGEVTYTTDWTPTQKLNEVKSPVIPEYLVDKDKVEELTVSNTSENTSVVVKYREAVKYIEHDADKDKKGTVIVKYVDANGTVLKEVKVKENVLVAKASTKKYTDREETTYTPTNEKYSVEKEKEFTIDEIKFVFNKLVPVSSKYNNTTEENGTVKEGTTTVVYEYKPVLPSNDIVNEKPEFNGGVNPIDPPVVDVPEYKEAIGGAIIPPEVHEKPEFKGGVSPIDPLVVEKPEAEVPKVEESKEEESKEVIKKKEELPVTSSSSMLGMFGLVGAFGMRKKRKKDK